MNAIIVHGGAGKKNKSERVKTGIKEAIIGGYKILTAGGDALTACCEAIKIMEDNPVFNAGTGSVLTLDGKCEMDASVMRGSDFAAGAVAGVKKIKNPIMLARKVMEETDHVLLIGEGAERFARLIGFKEYNPITSLRKREWRKLKEKFLKGENKLFKKIKELVLKYPELLYGTVGCVTHDEKGEIVAGTSTGGVSLKLFGRVGDTPVLGAGTYATSWGGVSATGVGEGIMRVVLAKSVCDLMRMGFTAQAACKAGIEGMNNTLPFPAGVIAIDSLAGVGYTSNTTSMPGAFLKKGLRTPVFFGF